MSLRIPALGCTLALALAACSGGSSESAAPVPSSPTTAGSAASSGQSASASTGPSAVLPPSSVPQSSAPAASTTPDSTTRTDKAFGEVTTFADTSDVLISAPAARQFGGTDAAVLTVTVSNRGKEEAPMQFWYFTATVDGKAVSPLTDAAHKIGQPNEMLGAGKTRTFRLAYPWKTGQKLQVTVTWRDSYPYTYSA